MAEQDIVDMIKEEKWASALVIGGLSIAGSLGLTVTIMIILGVLGLSLFLTVVFLPLVAAGVVSGLTWWLAGKVDLTGLRKLVATGIAGIGTLILLNTFDITVFSLAGARPPIETIGLVVVPGLSLIALFSACIWSFDELRDPLAIMLGAGAGLASFAVLDALTLPILISAAAIAGVTYLEMEGNLEW